MLNIDNLIWNNSYDKEELDKLNEIKKYGRIRLNFGKYKNYELRELIKTYEGRNYLFWLADEWLNDYDMILSPTQNSILKYIKNI